MEALEPPPVPPAPAEVSVPRGTEVKGAAMPAPPPKSEAQREWEASLSTKINVELNVYFACFQNTRNMVNTIIASTPADSADIGDAQFGPGKRMPIEEAEPYIALEVYRQVRREMRQDDVDSKDEVLKAMKLLGFDPKTLRKKK